MWIHIRSTYVVRRPEVCVHEKSHCCDEQELGRSRHVSPCLLVVQSEPTFEGAPSSKDFREESVGTQQLMRISEWHSAPHPCPRPLFTSLVFTTSGLEASWSALPVAPALASHWWVFWVAFPFKRGTSVSPGLSKLSPEWHSAALDSKL